MDGKKFFDLFPGTGKKVCFVFVHGDEMAAKAVALQAQKKFRGGAVIFLGRERCVSIGQVRVDPNRIWTNGPFHLADGSRISNVENHQIYSLVRPLVRQRLFWPLNDFIAKYETVIALHNNGKTDFSFNSFAKGQYSSQAQKVFPAKDHDKGDFVLVTRETDFSILSSCQDFNLILQRFNCAEDGSLSVWAARNGKRYFNIETKSRPRLEETYLVQQKMLEKVMAIL